MLSRWVSLWATSFFSRRGTSVWVVFIRWVEESKKSKGSKEGSNWSKWSKGYLRVKREIKWNYINSLPFSLENKNKMESEQWTFQFDKQTRFSGHKEGKKGTHCDAPKESKSSSKSKAKTPHTNEFPRKKVDFPRRRVESRNEDRTEGNGKNMNS